MIYRPELTKRPAGPIVNLPRMPHERTRVGRRTASRREAGPQARPMPDRAVVAIPRSFADMILVCAGTPARRKLSSTRLAARPTPAVRRDARGSSHCDQSERAYTG
jgi:hypothetical protein